MNALPDPEFWRGRRVLLTGHTGFKGAWAALWLSRLGANVTGLALPPETDPSLFALAGIDEYITSLMVDLRDHKAVAVAINDVRPDLVLHMAAQALVRRSLTEPVETFATNVMGTVHLLDALGRTGGCRAILVATSDKVYRNNGSGDPFEENDILGGDDPYSASKAAAELVVRAYGLSNLVGGARIATARGGNVIGGGDFSEDRIVPDVVRATRCNGNLALRHPEATRPWQHVLDCLAGYFLYLQALVGDDCVPSALNFGPDDGEPITVAALANALQDALGASKGHHYQPVASSIEKPVLALTSRAARTRLGWSDRLTGPSCIAETAGWYKAWMNGENMRLATLRQIEAYERLT
jgi:CDP-glucose 4,6-dehydratase